MNERAGICLSMSGGVEMCMCMSHENSENRKTNGEVLHGLILRR